MILHPTLGIVINGITIAGKGLVLTGGNLIGARGKVETGYLVLGDDINMGANAVILGPAKIGNQVRIGAGAVVIHDAPDKAVLVGVPAKVVKLNQ